MASWWILQICLVAAQLIYRGLGQADPCKFYKPLYDDGGRSIKCSLYHIDSHDRFIYEGWRRVQLESTGEYLTMPTQCIVPGYCGSHSNVWLNGTHPTVEDGIVDRIGCLSMFSSCCHVQYPIQIKNCTDYMVYNLKKTLGSDERYCFGDSADCFIRTTVPPRPHYGYRYRQTPKKTFRKFLHGKQKDRPISTTTEKKKSRHNSRTPHLPKQITESRSVSNPSHSTTLEASPAFTHNTNRESSPVFKSAKRAKNLSRKRKELEKVLKQIKKVTDKLRTLKEKENFLALKIEQLEEN